MKIIDAEPVMRRLRAALEICEEVRTNGRDELEAVLNDLESQPALGTNLAEVGTDCISRRQAIETFKDCAVNGVGIDGIVDALKQLPSAESKSFEWCTDCKEYDQEAHCCHRWSKMIRKTVEEMQIVHCKDCKYAEYIDDVQTLWCTECGQGRTVAPYDFCSYGERREDG